MLILADDLGYSDLGCYGSEIATPNLDGLAKGGLRYTNFYNTARCWPTRAAVMTGYYPQQVRRDTVAGVKSGSQGTRPEWARLFSQQLREQNYRNYHSGKWHIDGRPLAQGFDHSYDLGGISQSNYFKTGSVTDDEKPVPQSEGYYSTIGVADHAVRCLQEHAEKFADRPFFHYLCFTAPHFPLHALPEDIKKYEGKYTAGWNEIQQRRFAKQQELGFPAAELPPMERDVGPPYPFPAAMEKLGPGEVNRPLPWSELTPEQQAFQAQKMAIHAAMVDRMDQEIGKVLAQLKAMNAFENTLIFFHSDNGASAEIMVRGDGHDPSAPLGSAATYPCLGPGWSSCANTPFRRHKTWVHEGGISTPLIVHWPQGIAAKGEFRHTPGHVIDLSQTILSVSTSDTAATKITADHPASPGRSLVPSFAKDTHLNRDALWFLHEDNRAIRQGIWKLVAAKGNEWSLYDLSKDRGETHNLAAEHPDKVKELAAEWDRRAREYSATALKDAPPADLKKK
ncbi:arylsulfatase [Anatilimnocola floriformis]|uniref:arylsulfatase n=1 Tax=Anatilimnocola floriformis TaxID=2948575 RepID=UPI0020C4A891|nr:arylsulfatase [Anatilimnocola floriformis]